MTVVLSATALGLVLVNAACGDGTDLNAAGDPNLTPAPPTPNSCATPNTGCACATPGAVVPCGIEASGAGNFIYCYQGTRECLPTSTWGVCGAGSITTKALSTVPTSCAGGLTTNNVNVCIGGKRSGDLCTTNADCGVGFKRCTGVSEATTVCKDDSDCSASCGSYNGSCVGGTNNNAGCNVGTDCLGGGTCNIPSGTIVCGTFTGICDSSGATDGEECNSNADCGGGVCDPPKFGVCIGGKKNGKKCSKAKHCKGGGSCSNGNGPAPVNPCDPFCTVYSDTVAGIDAGPGFVFGDGGLTVLGCGDGILTPPEVCDDGNSTSGDGCSGGCTLEPGFQCPTPGSICTMTNCGNGIIEGLEECDDANEKPYDGCFKCAREVSCPSPALATAPARPCLATCGDGIKFPSEECDDGNVNNGDGCSSTCTVEAGASCMIVTSPLPASIDVPVIYRDFRGCSGALCGTTANIHPDFQSPAPHPAPGYTGLAANGACPAANVGPGSTCFGIPLNTLPADRAPAFLASLGTAGNSTSFNEWYRPNGRAIELFRTVNAPIKNRYLRLFKNAANAYVFDSASDTVTDDGINCGYGTATHCNNLGGFWPINGAGWGNYSAGKNFHFTSEVRLPFTYAGGEVFSFSGDDDVFVYIGGKKISDLGGIHGVANSPTITLGAGTNTFPNSGPGAGALGLVVGQTYEISVFQAERNTTGSNYKLTLQGFNRTTSSCTVPVTPQTLIRDFEGTCKAGQRLEWQLFRWKAAVPNAGSNITFRAATSDNPLTFSTNPMAAGTVAAGQATSTNSPAGVAANFAFLTKPNPAPPPATLPVPVSEQLKAASQTSLKYLRVYMTFTGAPILYEWQQLYNCVDEE